MQTRPDRTVIRHSDANDKTIPPKYRRDLAKRAGHCDRLVGH